MYSRRILGLVALAALAAQPALAQSSVGLSRIALPQIGIGQILKGVPNANPKVGTPATIIDPDFKLSLIATRSDPVENPSGPITFFGQLSTGVLTEPDQNLYLVLDHNPGGPNPKFNYGRHFLYQGHENAGSLAYITRINLDVPEGSPGHVMLLTPVNPATGLTGFNSIDGSTFDPLTTKLLFTQEAGASGGVIEGVGTNLDAFFGKAGYEGIHPDSKGTIYLIEDTGGTTSHTPAINNGRQPNSFVYRYVPSNPFRINQGGVLQALQVIVDGKPVLFGGAANVDADISAPAQLKLTRREPSISFGG